MGTSYTVMKSGNSAVVALPSTWRMSANVAIGDKLEVVYQDFETITYRKRDSGRRKQLEAFHRLLSLVDEVPGVPWEDDSKESDRALLDERYV